MKILEDITTIVTTISDNNSNAETSPQKSKLYSKLVTNSLYIKSIITSLYLLRDSIVWDSSTMYHISNNLNRVITLLQLLSEEIFISIVSGNKLIIEIANITITY